jgi:ABC-2 type transport system permease protein
LIAALWFYGLCSARNRIIKRTRDVRYLAGMALVIAYLYFVFGRSMSRDRTPQGSPASQGVLVLLLLLFLVIASLLTWWMEQGDHPLALNKPQAQFLIPAPLASRQVMLFKLLTTLPTLLWSALVMGLVFRAGLSPHPALRILTALMVIVALQLQRVGAALARTPQRGDGGSPLAIIVGVVRVWLVAATAVALAQMASVAVDHGLFGLAKMGIPFALAYQLPWSLVVWPFHALLAPAYAQTLPTFASSIAVALLIVAIETGLVFQAEPQWDSIGIARTKEERLNARRTRKRSRTSEGSLWERYITSLVKRPAAAITWKNLIATKHMQTLRPGFVMAIGVPIFLAATILPPLQHLTSFATGISGAWAGLLLFAGPQFVRNDMRLDLPRLRLLRTYPLTSLEICVAEVGASVSVLLALQFVMLILSTAALVFNPALPLGPGRILAIAVALACLLPGMTAMNVSGQNLFAVAFPKWTTLGTKRPSRTTNPGQAYFSLLVSAIVFVVSMILPAIAAAGIAYEVWPFGNSAAIIAAALVAGAIAIGEAALVLRWMATLFDRVDLASVTGESSG